MSTAIHRRVAACRAGADPTLIARLGSGWAVMGDPQVLDGYCLLLPDPVVPHLNALLPAAQAAFLADLARLGQSLLELTGAIRVNYAIFGNLEPALHAHVFPRRATEPAELGTTHPWACDWAAARRFDHARDGVMQRALRERLVEHIAPGAGSPLPPGGVHHLDLTAADLGRSTRFYDRVLPLLGFRRIADADDGPLWRGAAFELGLQAASAAGRTRPHDRYSPGLHHLAFAAPSRDAVDALHVQLVALGVTVLDVPAGYERYAPGYYATFFADPDGIKLEYVYTPTPAQ